MKADTKKSAQQRLTRIEGQVRGVSSMIGQDRYCIDVLTQLQAVRAALKRVEDEVLTDHLSHCVQQAFTHGNLEERQVKIDELLSVLGRVR